MSTKADYIGRFAPSPSGPLHFGSLVAALASYLDARSAHGLWLLRMEDLDPAREPPAAAAQILSTLEAFGLHWDGAVLYQSLRLEAYADALADLQERGLIYGCDCSRVQIQAMGGIYDNRCRLRHLLSTAGALRISVPDETFTFVDMIQGPQQQNLLRECGDFVLRRKDGLFAYQLAVVVDDAFQSITHIVRGSDLLDSTPRQLYLQKLLGFQTLHYAHIPVAVNHSGQKLSKQHFAAPLDLQRPTTQMLAALQFLGQFSGQHPDPYLATASPAELLAWGTAHWDIQAVPKLATIPLQSDS